MGSMLGCWLRDGRSRKKSMVQDVAEGVVGVETGSSLKRQKRVRGERRGFGNGMGR